MNENKRLIKNTGVIAIGNISTKLVSFLLLPLYTSLLSTSQYGTYDFILSIATFCVPFVSCLMDESVFRFLIDCENEQEKKKVISTSGIIVIAGMLLFLIVGIPIMYVVHYSYAFYVIAYILLNVLCGMMSALLRGIGRTDQYAIFNFLLGTIQIILNVIFIAFFQMGLEGLLWAAILSQLSVSILFIIKIHLWDYITARNIDVSIAKEMIIYSVPLIPNKISWTIINLSDRIILMLLLGSEAAGIYAISYKFPNLMDTIYGFFYQSWKESSSRVLKNHEGSQIDFYNSVYCNLKNFMYAIVLGMIAFMPLVFQILINKSYHDAIFYVPILLIGTYFSNISGFYGGIFTAYKDTKIMGTTTVAAAVINLVVNLVLIKNVGIYAAAFSTLVANIVVYLYRKQKVKKYIVLKESIADSIISIVLTIIILLLYYSQNKIGMVIACTISVIYAVVTNKDMIYFMLKYVKRLKA